MKRKAHVGRNTKETQIDLTIGIDGQGSYAVKTPIPFLNHMLELFAKHGLFDLTLKATGDVDVDDHHLVEDIGICLGEATRKAIGNKQGIRRYGHCTLPMDEVLASVTVDLSGRPSFVYHTPLQSGRIKNFDVELVEHFFEALTNSLACNLHCNVLYGRVKHHIVEAIFKAFARALDQATQLDNRVQGVPSTKGRL